MSSFGSPTVSTDFGTPVGGGSAAVEVNQSIADFCRSNEFRAIVRTQHADLFPRELGYAEYTGAGAGPTGLSTSATSPTDFIGPLSVSVGSNPIDVIFTGVKFVVTASNTLNVDLWIDGKSYGNLATLVNGTTASITVPVHQVRRMSLPTGIHSFKLAAWVASAGSLFPQSIYTTAPMSLRVVECTVDSGSYDLNKSTTKLSWR